MKQVENQYYRLVKLPKSPYIDQVSGAQSNYLPSYPPRPTSQSRTAHSVADYKFADSFYDLDAKRRGLI
jgi:hypothetical protein